MQRIARSASAPTVAPALLNDIRRLITDARGRVASTANATLTMLYWQVGQRIRTEVLRDQRATYGERIVVSVGRQLSAEYGAGFADKNLRRMMQFAEVFPSEKIVVSLIRQLSWTHCRRIPHCTAAEGNHAVETAGGGGALARQAGDPIGYRRANRVTQASASAGQFSSR